MSSFATSWAWRQEPGCMTSKFLLMALCDHASGEDHICWPGNKYLAKKICASERTVMRAIQKLIDGGFIEIAGKVHKKDAGKVNSNVYRINAGANVAHNKQVKEYTVSDNLSHTVSDKMTPTSTKVSDNLSPSSNEVGDNHDTSRAYTIYESLKDICSKPIGLNVSCKIQNEPSKKELFPFSEFWAAYPRKQNKKKSELAWKKVSTKDRQKILIDIKTRFQGTDKQFIPLATTYLNGERWNDEKLSNDSQVNNPFGDKAYGV